MLTGATFRTLRCLQLTDRLLECLRSFSVDYTLAAFVASQSCPDSLALCAWCSLPAVQNRGCCCVAVFSSLMHDLCVFHGCFNWHYACCIRLRHKSVRASQIFVSNSLATKVAQNALCPSTRGIPYMGLNTAESDSSATELSNGTWHNSLGDL